MPCATTHEKNKRTRTMHLRNATFSTQRGPWRSTHHGLHSPRASNVEGRQETIEAALHIVRMHAFHPPCAYFRILTIGASGPAMLHYALPCNHEFLFRRNFRNLFLVQVPVGRHSFRGQTPEPVIQRNVDK